MVVDSKLTGILLPANIHANRPAANAVAGGAIFPCITHGKQYQSDGSSWSDWFDPTTMVGAHAHSGADITSGTVADARIDAVIARDTEVAAAVTGLLDFKGATDCSGNPNYPAASKGDAYVVSVAGKIGGGSGVSVDVGDVYVASADNAGGTQGSVGTSWFVLEHNLAGAYLVGGTDVAVADGGTGASTASSARTNLGISAANTPITDAGSYFTGTDVEAALQELGAASVGSGGDTSGQFVVGFDGGGNAITAGKEQDVVAPFTGTIASWELLADQNGSAVVDIYKDVLASYPPTGADSITAAAKPMLSSADHGSSSTLTGWTTAVTAGDILRFHLDSAAAIQRLLVVITYTRP